MSFFRGAGALILDNWRLQLLVTRGPLTSGTPSKKLDRFWTGFGLVLTGFGQVLDRFKKSTILDRFWTGSGQVFDGF